MAPPSSTLAWRIPGTGEPGGRPSMGSHRVGHDWSDLAAALCFPLCLICQEAQSQIYYSVVVLSVLGVHWKDWCWSWNSNTLATWCEELTHLKRPRCWERLKAGGEGDNRGWDAWMASSTQWTWVWWTPGVGDGQGDLACCSSWGCKELHTTEWLNWTKP